MDHATLVEALMDPGFYDQPVEIVEYIQTHISSVFLTGELAYKLKKPMDFGFLDFTTTELRRRYCEAEVVLTHGGREVMGVATGSGSQAQEARLLAEATAQALERFLDDRYRVSVGRVESSSSFSNRGVILVTVLLGDGRQERPLLGCCWSDEGLRRAAVYATLDATNRIFGRLERREHIDYEVGSASPSGEVSEAKSD